MRDGICDMGYEKGYEINDMGYEIYDIWNMRDGIWGYEKGCDMGYDIWDMRYDIRYDSMLITQGLLLITVVKQHWLRK